MLEFTLETLSEKIHYGKTKEYFRETLSSYNNGNYRSAAVTLWSVAVCDIVYKLQSLIDIYSDTSAEKILKKLTEEQEKKPRSSEWELQLIDETFKLTNLLDSSEYENLRYLQKQRHLCAHPTLNKNRELHCPNKETVRALIRNTLEDLLTKPPIYTQKILNELLEDINENKPALNTKDKLKSYLESRYLSRLTEKAELSILKSLWKIVFKLENEECNNHRLINLQTLEIIGDRLKSKTEDLIKEDIDYFSNIASSGIPLCYLTYYLSKKPELYELLSKDAHIKITHCINTDRLAKTTGWYIKNDLKTHYDDLASWIKSSDNPTIDNPEWRVMKDIADTEEWQFLFCKLLALYYGASRSFDQADNRFNQSISPFLNLFNKEAITSLLFEIEGNTQTNYRSRAANDHHEIMERMEEIGIDQFSINEFPKFKSRVLPEE